MIGTITKRARRVGKPAVKQRHGSAALELFPCLHLANGETWTRRRPIKRSIGVGSDVKGASSGTGATRNAVYSPGGLARKCDQQYRVAEKEAFDQIGEAMLYECRTNGGRFSNILEM